MKELISALLVAGVLTLGGLNDAEAQGPYVNGGSAGPKAVVGWNFFNPTQCLVASTGFFLIYVPDGGVGWTNDPVIVAAVGPACQTGNLIAIHITSLAPFLWDMAVVYPFK